ncbi:MAG: hypothetical protein GX575_33670 [Candidatus Anammoximicrobium sp.]|nr:hypothetical protein [Candidatus Anammoximicrobium sp.]
MPQEKAIELRIAEVSIAIASMLAILWGVNMFIIEDPFTWGPYAWVILIGLIGGLIYIVNLLKERHTVVAEKKWISKHLPMLVILFVSMMFSGLMFGVAMDVDHRLISGIETGIMIVFGAWGLSAEVQVDEQRKYEKLQEEMPAVQARDAAATEAKAWTYYYAVRAALGNFLEEAEVREHARRLFDKRFSKKQLEENLEEFKDLIDRGVQMIAAIEEKRVNKPRIAAETRAPEAEEGLPPDVLEEQKKWERSATHAERWSD